MLKKPKRGGLSLAAIAVAAAFLTTCDGASPAAPGGGNAPAMVGSSGGMVSLGAEASVDVPPGALSSTILIGIAPVSTPPTFAAAGAVGQAYDFTPDDFVFINGVMVSIFVSDQALAGVDAEDLILVTNPPGEDATVEPLSGIRVDQVAGGVRVSGSTLHFSPFQPAAPNEPPTSDAGPDQQVLVGQTVNLTGQGEDPDGDPITFSWSFDSRPAGSSAEIQSPDSATAMFVADVTGTYIARLTVADDRGVTASDTISIVADAVNVPPTADAGPNQQANVGQAVTLRGDGDDADGDPLTFDWSFDARPVGSTAVIHSGQASTTFVPDLPGRYIVRLTVDDGRGGTASDTATITAIAVPTVVDVQLLPSLQFSPAQVTIQPGTTIRWANTTNIFHTVTPDGHTEFARATFNQTGESFQHTFNTPGKYDYFCEPHVGAGMRGTVIVQ